MSKFKVGDKVRVLDASQDSHLIGNIVEIEKIDSNYIYVKGGSSPWVINTNKLELVEEVCEPCCSDNIEDTIDRLRYAISGNIITVKKQQSIMSKITTFAKNLVLSADEKLLRKYGLHDECGNHTDEAEELVMAKLVKENESYLVELATAMQAEEAKK